MSKQPGRHAFALSLTFAFSFAATAAAAAAAAAAEARAHKAIDHRPPLGAQLLHALCANHVAPAAPVACKGRGVRARKRAHAGHGHEV